jgi:hypothetical protein
MLAGIQNVSAATCVTKSSQIWDSSRTKAEPCVMIAMQKWKQKEVENIFAKNASRFRSKFGLISSLSEIDKQLYYIIFIVESSMISLFASAVKYFIRITLIALLAALNAIQMLEKWNLDRDMQQMIWIKSTAFGATTKWEFRFVERAVVRSKNESLLLLENTGMLSTSCVPSVRNLSLDIGIMKRKDWHIAKLTTINCLGTYVSFAIKSLLETVKLYLKTDSVH